MITAAKEPSMFSVSKAADITMPPYANISAAKEQKPANGMMIYKVLFYRTTSVFLLFIGLAF